MALGNGRIIGDGRPLIDPAAWAGVVRLLRVLAAAAAAFAVMSTAVTHTPVDGDTATIAQPLLTALFVGLDKWRRAMAGGEDKA